MPLLSCVLLLSSLYHRSRYPHGNCLIPQTDTSQHRMVSYHSTVLISARGSTRHLGGLANLWHLEIGFSPRGLLELRGVIVVEEERWQIAAAPLLRPILRLVAAFALLNAT